MLTALADLNQPYSCTQWGNAPDGGGSQIVHDTGYDIWELFETGSAFPSTVFITHDAVGSESRQVFKKVLRNGATGVFQGKILVKPNAQKTDGYQISQSLLLDEDSQFLAKPELEIYADDVACSHGSTSGAIDEEALFYLTSRGISKQIAIDMLTMAFLAEAVEEIENIKLKQVILDLLTNWLERHRS